MAFTSSTMLPVFSLFPIFEFFCQFRTVSPYAQSCSVIYPVVFAKVLCKKPFKAQ
jgi:hypothetical protein